MKIKDICSIVQEYRPIINLSISLVLILITVDLERNLRCLWLIVNSLLRYLHRIFHLLSRSHSRCRIWQVLKHHRFLIHHRNSLHSSSILQVPSWCRWEVFHLSTKIILWTVVQPRNVWILLSISITTSIFTQARVLQKNKGLSIFHNRVVFTSTVLLLSKNLWIIIMAGMSMLLIRRILSIVLIVLAISILMAIWEVVLKGLNLTLWTKMWGITVQVSFEMLIIRTQVRRAVVLEVTWQTTNRSRTTKK